MANKNICLSDLSLDVLLKLLFFAKTHYEDSLFFFTDVLDIKTNNSNIGVYLAKKRFFRRHALFLKHFKMEDFGDSLNDYARFMLYVFDNFKDIDIIIYNLSKVFEFGFDKIYFCEGQDRYHLYYQPDGMLGHEYGSILYYLEENFYSDVCPNDSYDGECVILDFDNPMFVMKGFRKKGFSGIYGDFFDKISWDMMIYDLRFDNTKLPTLDDLENTMCHLDSYKLLVYDKKRAVLEKKVLEFSRNLDDMETLIQNIYELMDDLEISDYNVIYEALEKFHGRSYVKDR